MEVGEEVVTRHYEKQRAPLKSPFSLIFTNRGRSDDGTYTKVIILRKEHDKFFILIVESDHPPDAITGRITREILDFVVKKYNDHKR